MWDFLGKCLFMAEEYVSWHICVKYNQYILGMLQM